MDRFARLWNFFCGRAVNGELLFDSKDYGPTNRSSSRCGNGFDLLLGDSIGRNTGNDFRYSTYGIYHNYLAFIV
jgi:hypothetical protein